MIVFSFQSQKVVDTILSAGYYESSSLFCREKRDYSEDIAQLAGKHPIWCFVSTKKDEFEAQDFTDGVLLERFRCEMSLDQEIGLTGFKMLEIEVDANAVFEGKTHNSYSGSKVLGSINKSQLRAVYRVEHTSHWYYKNIVLEQPFCSNPFFGKVFSPKKEIIRDNTMYSLVLGPIVGQEYYFFNYSKLTKGVLKEIVNGDEYVIRGLDYRSGIVESLYLKQ